MLKMATPQEPTPIFRPWEDDLSTKKGNDTVKDDQSFHSKRIQTDHKENSNSETEKQKDRSYLATKAECSEKEQQMETKTFSSLSENTETGRSAYQVRSSHQSTSCYNYCAKNVDGNILDAFSLQPLKPSLSSAAKSKKYVPCISPNCEMDEFYTYSYNCQQESNATRIIRTKPDISQCTQSALQSTDDSNYLKYLSQKLPTNAKTCDICRRKFTRWNHLVQHMSIHSGEKPFQCDACNKTFSRKSILDIHVRTHTGAKPYQCDACNKTFSQKSHLNKHARIHTGAKPYQCDACNKTFTQKSHLNEHVRTHTGVKPYSCNLCSKAFRTSSNLNRHKKTHAK